MFLFIYIILQSHTITKRNIPTFFYLPHTVNKKRRIILNFKQIYIMVILKCKLQTGKAKKCSQSKKKKKLSNIKLLLKIDKNKVRVTTQRQKDSTSSLHYSTKHSLTQKKKNYVYAIMMMMTLREVSILSQSSS